jgi:hypothetical protein
MRKVPLSLLSYLYVCVVSHPAHEGATERRGTRRGVEGRQLGARPDRRRPERLRQSVLTPIIVVASPVAMVAVVAMVENVVGLQWLLW